MLLRMLIGICIRSRRRRLRGRLISGRVLRSGEGAKLGSLEVISKGPPVFKSPIYRVGAMKLAVVGHVPILTIQYHDCISNHRSFSSLDCVLFFGYLVCYIPLRIRHYCTHNTLTTRAPLVLLSSPLKPLYHGQLSDGTKPDKLRWLRLCDAAVQSDMAILLDGALFQDIDPSL